MERLMIIPRVEGNLENGRRIYRQECAYCHRGNGRGAGEFPMIVGKYSNYLLKQVAAYIRKERPHDGEEPGGILNGLAERDILDLMAYLTALQYPEEAPR